MKNTNIEVEGGEILIQSKEGHYAVIPAKHRKEVMDMVKDGCDGCINNYIQTLPKDSDYAEDGTVFPTQREPITLISPSGRRIDTDTDSEFYRTHYNSKLIGQQNPDKSWNLTDEIYGGSDLPEVTVSAKIKPNTLSKPSSSLSIL